MNWYLIIAIISVVSVVIFGFLSKVFIEEIERNSPREDDLNQ